MGSLIVATTSGAESPAQLRFEQVYRGARTAQVALVRRVLDHAEAEDVVQEAFLKLSDDPVLDRPDHEVTAWLRRVCLNLAFNRVRDVGRWRDRSSKAEPPVASIDPAVAAERNDACRRVRSILAELPDKQRDCLLLRHAGYSYAEVAETLQVPKSSIGTTLARAERAFKTLYLQANPEIGED